MGMGGGRGNALRLGSTNGSHVGAVVHSIGHTVPVSINAGKTGTRIQGTAGNTGRRGEVEGGGSGGAKPSRLGGAVWEEKRTESAQCTQRKKQHRTCRIRSPRRLHRCHCKRTTQRQGQTNGCQGRKKGNQQPHPQPATPPIRIQPPPNNKPRYGHHLPCECTCRSAQSWRRLGSWWGPQGRGTRFNNTHANAFTAMPSGYGHNTPTPNTLPVGAGSHPLVACIASSVAARKSMMEPEEAYSQRWIAREGGGGRIVISPDSRKDMKTRHIRGCAHHAAYLSESV
jgi:hypothetical protein